MNSILANVFLAVQNRLAAMGDLKFIDQDMGQLDFYDPSKGDRIPVAFPCALIDVVDAEYTDNSLKGQQGEAILEVRLAVAAYSASTHYYSTEHKENALSYFNLEHNVVKQLHGWSDDHYFNPLSRKRGGTEKRQDNIRVRVLRFAFGFKDNTAMDVTYPVMRPDLEVDMKE